MGSNIAVHWIDGYKKFIITMYSVSVLTLIAVMASYTIHDDTIKRDVFLVVVGAIGGLAGYHGFTQGKIDSKKAEQGDVGGG